MRADAVIALVRAHVEGNSDHFRSVVLSIAANEATKSPKTAHTLRLLADRRPQSMIQLPPQVGQNLAGSHPTTKLTDMVLDDHTRERIDCVLLEQRSRDRLFVYGLRPQSKLLLTGPPGVGKTMAASAMAAELQIPLMRVQLHATIASHMGETAANLGKIFENVKRMRGVYLFDEFDALARSRDDNARSELAEMGRVVNSLLQFIEDDQSESLIVAATNHPGVIDRAMLRRFDSVIDFPIPDADDIERLVRARLIFASEIDWPAVRAAASGMGHADIAAACDRVSRDAVIADRLTIETQQLLRAFACRRSP